MGKYGQSSVEYLATYGWMAVAVTVAGAALYPTLNTGCNTEISNDIVAGGLSIEQVGTDTNGTLKVVFDSNTDEELQIEAIEMRGQDDQLTVVQPKMVPPGGNLAYDIGTVRKTTGCDNFRTTITFDKGPLQNQKKVLNIIGPYDLVDRFLSLVRTKGDTIESIKVDTSIKPTNNSMCFGLGCNRTEGEPAEEPEKYLNYSGDTMRGTLRVDRVKTYCFGEGCESRDTGLKGYVNSNNSFMSGTLNITEIMPRNDTDKTLLIE